MLGFVRKILDVFSPQLFLPSGFIYFSLNYPFIYTYEFTCLSIIFQYNITAFPDLAKMVVRVWRQVAVISANVPKDSVETTVKVRYRYDN